MRSLALLSSLAFAVACSPATPGPQPVAPKKPVGGALVAPVVASPAKWRLDPTGASIATKLEVEGGTLWVGTAGERWLAPKKGGLVAADTILKGPIAGAQRDEAGRFLFVADDGSVAITKDPLGPIVDGRAPKSPMRSVAVGHRAIVGIAGNALHRSQDGGATFAPVALPASKGTLVQVAMLPGGEGLLLIAPQRVLATTDDGATWEQVATPGIGARQVLADANGDLMLEGLLASAVLRKGPLRLERVAKAPAVGLEMPVAESKTDLLGAEAVWAGTAAIDGEHWAEAFPDPEDPERWSIAVAELGKAPVTKRLDFEYCERVYVAMRWPTILVGCNGQGTGAAPKLKSKWAPPAPLRFELRLVRSDDGGKTFKDDGAIPSNDREKHVWLGPDGLVLVDGACKRSRSDYDCADSPPVVRPPGAKSVAKAVDGFNVRFDRVVFGGGGRAWALGTDPSSRPALWTSSNGGKHFTRRPLPPGLDAKGNVIAPTFEGASLTLDDAGNAIALLRADGGRLLRYTATPDGPPAPPQPIDLEVDGFDLHGRFGFAYTLPAGAFETSDHGATWRPVNAPALAGGSVPERSVACSAAGCLVGARASRIGWDLGKGAPPAADASKPAPQIAYRTPLRCTTEGGWQELGIGAMPGAGNADLGGKSRWILAKRDPSKGSLTAVVASSGAKGLEVKEVSLFGPQPKDSAGVVVMQLEGVAALRYSFKRDKPTTLPTPPPIVIPPKTGVAPKPWLPPVVTTIVPQQIVDVDVAWYVAETGKVHRATIKGAGSLDPVKDVYDNRDLPSQARIGLLSIASGGIHVRPFASAGADAPLYFVSESGKVEKLSWPEVPKTDVRGKSIAVRLDAARIQGRSIVFGDVGGSGLQIFLGAPSGAGAGSDAARAWGLWPSVPGATAGAQLRFVDSGAAPMLGVLWPGDATNPAAGWAVPLEIGKNDPEAIAPLPSSGELEDPPKPCGASPGPFRVALPWAPGTRHPVVVAGEGEELVLASSTLLVRSGPDGAACARALDAFQTTYKSSGSYGAMVSIYDLDHAALFRTTYKSGAGTELAYRPMRCAFEKGPLPEALQSAAGFTR